MDTSSHTLDASNHILDTAVTIVRKFRTLTSTTTVKHSPVVSSHKQESDEYVIVDGNCEASTALPETSEHDVPESTESTESTASPVPVSPEHAQMLLFNEFSDFAEKYPYLFRMCTNVPTDESADNFVQILPLMLRQRDKIIESSGAQMKSATEAIIGKLHDTYVAPHGIEMPNKKKGGSKNKESA
jgi:hypothetical protein